MRPITDDNLDRALRFVLEKACGHAIPVPAIIFIRRERESVTRGFDESEGEIVVRVAWRGHGVAPTTEVPHGHA